MRLKSVVVKRLVAMMMVLLLCLQMGSSGVWAIREEGHEYISQGQEINSTQGFETAPMIAAGFAHTLILRGDGSVWAWGVNSTGQLGDGTRTDRQTPIQVQNLDNIIAISAANHSLALRSDGTVWIWGAHAAGSRRIGGSWYDPTPVQVPDLDNIVAISAAVNNGILALRSDGTVWAWNASVNLEDDTFMETRVPVQIPNLDNVIAISEESTHVLALRSDGTVWAWGSNWHGQIGDHVTTLHRRGLAQVPDLHNITAVETGSRFTAVLSSDGTVWTRGWNWGGQLGAGLEISSWRLRQAAIPAYITEISAGDHHTIAIDSNGRIWTWGSNGSGEIGDGTTRGTFYVNQPPPVQVPNLDNIMAVAAGWSNTFAIRRDGSVWAWGWNGSGELGIGEPNLYTTTPVRVRGPGGIGHFNVFDGNQGELETTNQNNLNPNVFSYVVLDSVTGEPITDATVTRNGITATTNAGGIAEFSFALGENRNTRVIAPGYYDYEWRWPYLRQGHTIVFMRQNISPGLPYITAVHTNPPFRIYHHNLIFSRVSIEVGNLQEYTITLLSNWEGRTPGSYVLFQGDREFRSTDGVFRIRPGESFEPGLPVYAQLVDANGVLSAPVEIEIQMRPQNGRIQPANTFQLGRSAGGRADLGVFGLLDFEMDFGFLPFAYEREGNVVRYIFGVDAETIDFTNDNPFHNWNVVKESIRDMADARRRLDASRIHGANGKSSQMTVTSKWSPKYDVAGYLKLVYDDNGDLVSSQGHLVLGVGAKYEHQSQFMAGPVPMVFEFNFDANLKMSTPVNLTEQIMIPQSKLTFSAGLGVGAGVGVARILNVTLGGEGNFVATMDFGENHTTGNLRANLYLRLRALFYSNTWRTPATEWQIWDHTFDSSNRELVSPIVPTAESMSPIMPTAESMFPIMPTAELMFPVMPTAELIDTSEFTLIPKDYQASPWYNGGGIMRLSAGIGETLLQSGVFPFAKPRIEVVSGLPVMVWIGDTVGRSVINRTTLFFSTYQSGTWSEPRQVWEGSVTADMDATLRSNGGNLYVVWQKMSRVLDDHMTLAEVAPYVEIAAARFDSTTQQFVEARFLTDDRNYHFLPNVAIDFRGQARFTWITNSENDIFGVTGSNVFMSCSGELATISKPILSYDITLRGGNIEIVYAANEDGDLLNYDVVNLYRIISGNHSAITTGAGLDALPFFRHDVLHWHGQGTVRTESGALFSAESSVNYSYRILNRPDGNIAVVWVESLGGHQSGIFARIQNRANWSEDILLHVSEQPIRSFDGFFDGHWNFVLTTYHPETEEVSMVSLRKPPVSRIGLDFATGDERNVVSGLLPITVDITNIGEATTSAYIIELSGPDYHYSQTVHLNLPPNRSGTLTASFPMPTFTEETEFTVRVYPADRMVEYGAKTTIRLGRPDLAVEAHFHIVGGTTFLTTSVTNQIDLPADASITLYKNGNRIRISDLGEISNGRKVAFVHQINEVLDFVNGVAVFEVMVESGDRQFTEMFMIQDVAGAEVRVRITLDATGGTVSPSTIQGRAGRAYGALPTPVRRNFRFDGWYTAATGGERVTSTTVIANAAAHTLYARWLRWGDVNGDDRVDSRDLELLQRHLNFGHLIQVQLNLRVADVILDGRIDSNDLALLQRYLNFRHLIQIELGVPR